MSNSQKQLGGVEIGEPEIRALAKVSLSMFIAHRQGVDHLERIEKDVIAGFASFHNLDRDAVTHLYLSAMKTLSEAPFVFCAIHSKVEYIDAILQNPSSPDQVTEFVAKGLESVMSSMNFTIIEHL
jgi:hypothetical protein